MKQLCMYSCEADAPAAVAIEQSQSALTKGDRLLVDNGEWTLDRLANLTVFNYPVLLSSALIVLAFDKIIQGGQEELIDQTAHFRLSAPSEMLTERQS